MRTVNVYLNFNGNCEEAFEFYKSVFGGEYNYLGRFKDTPPEYPVPEEHANKILHVGLPIGGDTSLMGSDVIEGFGPEVKFGNNFSLTVSVDSEQEADTLFNALAEGGAITMPMQKTFWGAYFGCLTDKFGVNWMLSYELQQG